MKKNSEIFHMVDPLIGGLSVTLFWRRDLHPFKYHIIYIPISLDMRLRIPFMKYYIWDSLYQALTLCFFSNVGKEKRWKFEDVYRL